MTEITSDVRQRLIWVLLVLTAVTGLVDTVSFLRFGTVFVANMTGNVIFLGFALADAGRISIFGPVVAIPAFVLGALGAGRLVSELAGSPRRWTIAGSGTQTAMVGAATVLVAGGVLAPSGSSRFGLVAMLAFAMGIQNAIVRRLGVADLTTTVLTPDPDRPGRRVDAGGRRQPPGLSDEVSRCWRCWPEPSPARCSP